MPQSDRPTRFSERVGAALIAPRVALAAADHPDNAGRTGNDAALLLALYVAAVYAHQIVIAGWLGATDSLGAGLGAFAGMLGGAVGTDLIVIVAAGIATTVAAGSRRSIGRDFDLACVAYVPFVVVRLATQLLGTVVDVRGMPWIADGMAVVALAWVGAVLWQGVVIARRRTSD